MGRRVALVALGLALVGTPVALMNRKSPGYAPTPEAARLYKEGQWHYYQLTAEAHEKALDYLNRAVQVDPKFVQPYGEMMALYTWLFIPGITNEQIRLQKVREIADKALAINPNSAEGYTALSWCRFLERDWRGAEEEIQRAIRYNPDFGIAHDIYCFYLSMQGRFEEAKLEGQRAVKLRSPEARRASAIIASWPFIAERRFDLAIIQLQSVLELEPNFTFGLNYLASCHEANSDIVAAIDIFRADALQGATNPDKVLAVCRELRDAFDAQGQQGYYRKWIELVLAQDSQPEAEWVLTTNPLDLAAAYSMLGEKAKALDLLEEIFDRPQVWHQLKFMPQFDRLHDESRFKVLLKKAGLEQLGSGGLPL